MAGKHRSMRITGILIATAAVAVAGFAGSAAAAGYLAGKSPFLANRIDPGNGLAAGKAVSLRQVMGGQAHRLTLAERGIVLRGLRRDPLSRAALRDLGLDDALAKRDAKARAIFHLSDRISRRDPATQIWLINDRASHGDLAGALAHYNAALSTSPSASAVLYPALTKALAYPQIDPQLAPLIHDGRIWTEAFVIYATGQVSKAADLARVLQAASPLPNTPQRDVILSQVLQRFVAEGDVMGARAFAQHLMGASPTVLDQFAINETTAAAKLAPLTWSVPEGGTVFTELSPKGQAEILAPPDGSGTVLTRTFLPRPGQFTFEQSISYPDGGEALGLKWQATCMAGKTGRSFWSQLVPAVARNSRYRMNLTIPANCTAVRFDLEVLGSERSTQALVVVSGLDLKRAS